VDRTLESFRQDDQNLLLIRNRVLSELINYSKQKRGMWEWYYSIFRCIDLQFDFPSGKIEALLEAKAEKMRRHSSSLEDMKI
jgi:hypothetical protein